MAVPRLLALAGATSATLLATGLSVAETRHTPANGLEREAREFMSSYERDLRSHAREAIIARYDERGVYLLGNGSKSYLPADTVAARYRTRWPGFDFFEFIDLSYETIGTDAVVVAGQFRSKFTGRPDTTLTSYTGLLLRRGGRLRIRLEDESSRVKPQ